MKVAVASDEPNINSAVALHFGRSKWFYVFDTFNQTGHFFENTNHLQIEGAGCNAASALIELGVEMAVAGRFGSKVTSLFRNSNVQQVLVEKPITIKKFVTQLK